MQKSRLVHCPISTFLPETSPFDSDKVVITFESMRNDIARQRPENVQVVTSVRDVPADDAGLLLLVGNESAEARGSDTLALLFASTMQAFDGCGKKPLIFVQGGMGSPEAVASYLMTGADGVVLEALHWLTDGVPGDRNSKERIAALRMDHTRLIGQRLGTPGRFFDKGNSRAAREMEALADALSAGGIEDGACETFFEEISRLRIPALAASFSPDELICIGPEAAFANAFVNRFGTDTQTALTKFIAAVEHLMLQSATWVDAYAASSAARDLGTRFPLLQGAMTWITDRPQFALDVARAGALPTLALGGRTREQLDRDFSGVKQVMGNYPYAMNILVLEENRFRDEQLAWLDEHRPPFVVIAAGDPSYVERLKRTGQRVMYLCPDAGLLRLALKAGADFMVLEGTEAGGHVGAHSTQMLAQMALLMRRQEPDLFRSTRVVLAGGIFDRASALRAAVLGAEAIQMGTAYLATEEIVASGALPALYQRLILEAAPGDTVVSGETVGLRVRSLRTPRMQSILELERQVASAGEEEREFRHRLESMSIGTLLIATRGVRHPGEAVLDEDTCFQEGQYMSGAAAGCLHAPMTLAALHSTLVSSPIDLAVPAERTDQSGRERGLAGNARQNGRPERIAITGLALANSLGHDTETFWQASLAMKSGVTEVPSSRWEHARYFDPNPRKRNTTYSPVGAFMNLEIDRRDLWVTPQDYRTMSLSTRLSLLLAARAIDSAGLADADIASERISVIISQNSGEVASTVSEQVVFVRADDIADVARDVLGISDAQTRTLADALRRYGAEVDDTTLIGRLNCTAGGHISNRYGFQGPSYSVGAACATSLVALHAAVMLMRQGCIDAAVVGGGEEPLTPAHYLEFSALGALAGIKGQRTRPDMYSRPFDVERDGFVMGEGGAMLVLERESVARARGARPLAYITGVGAANNDQGIVESVAESQQIALRLSFEDAGYGPDEVDLVECHATSTMQGDREEVKALRHVFPVGSGAVLAGLKSQIGHTLGASGITAIGRAVMAMRDGILPGTCNVEQPDPALGIEEHGFRVLGKPEAWASLNRPRRAQVNAFGFGGASFVIHLESASETERWAPIPDFDPAGDGAPSPVQVQAFTVAEAGQTWRVAVLGESSCDAERRLMQVGKLPARDDSKALAALARQGIFAAPDLPSPPTAMILSGQGGFYPGMGRELYDTFPVIREAMDRMASVADFDLLGVLFDAGSTSLCQTRWQQPALFTLEYSIAMQLMDLGFTPDAMAGHSLGELTALTLAGVMSPEDGFRVVNERGLCMDLGAEDCEDPGTMIATDAPCGIVERLTGRYPMVVVTNYNSLRQTVFGGLTAPTMGMAEELRSQGFRCTPLAVSLAFHSPVMQIATPKFAAFLNGIELRAPRIPVVSNVTGECFPNDPQAIREIMVRHLETAVRWTGNVQTLWLDHGIRTFVEIGPGQVLCSLVGDIIEHAVCVNTCLQGRESEALRSALAALFTAGRIELSVKSLVLSDRSARQVKSDPEPAVAPAFHVAGGVLEDVIAIIMDATGYDRSEIDPDMDLRQDLAIRSSRLPVIMDQAEKTFGIVIRIEDFIGVNTVREMAQCISGLSGRPMENGGDSRNQTLEEVIAIIMDATGYERGEIEPDMDLRQDLAIRSSRLPVIMDQAEKTFGIVIRIEDFIGVNTVREMARRIEALRTGKSGDSSPAPRQAPDSRWVEGLDTSGKSAMRPPVSRLEMVWEPVADMCGESMNLHADDCVVVVAVGLSTGWDREVGSCLQELLGCRILQQCLAPGEAAAVIRVLVAESKLAGLVFVLDGTPDGDVGQQLVIDSFTIMRHFLGRSERRLGVSLHSVDHAGPAGLVSEGLLGMLLACGLEYPSLHLRSLGLGHGVSTKQALARALDLSAGPIQLFFEDGPPRSPRMIATGIVPGFTSNVAVNSGDVIVISGGARGVCRAVALKLAVYGAYLVLLGRSPAGPETDAVIAELAAAGAGAEYQACDVTDAQAVAVVMADVAERMGHIDGIIHGAGILRDNLAVNTTPEDFTAVLRVKADGLRHLVNASASRGLRFVFGLSSVAAWQGNIGQVAYCAANRAMAALLAQIDSRNGITARALWLPPVEGAGGMADNPETRELMRLKGLDAAFVHVDEVGEFLLRELSCGTADGPWVMFSRPLPETATVLSPQYETAENSDRKGWGLSLPADVLPMVEAVCDVDLKQGRMTTRRTFRHDFDLWLADHRPHPSMRHPLVSAVMVIETFLEGAQTVIPYLHPRGLEDVRFKDMIPVPENTPRETRTRFSRSPDFVSADLEVRDVSPAGRPLDRWTSCYDGKILFGPGQDLAGTDVFFSAETLDTGFVSRRELEQWYEKGSAQTGRYRIVDAIEGSGANVIAGRVVYPDGRDFSGLGPVETRYPLYLLEAMMQLAIFHDVARGMENSREPLPVHIREILIGRRCAAGQEIRVLCRRSETTDRGMVWDAQALNAEGRTMLLVRGIHLAWTR